MTKSYNLTEYLILILIIFLFSFTGNTQYFVDGIVYDEQQQPIPFAKIFIKNAPAQRTVADIDGKYQISMSRGEYFLVFSATGFDTREAYISVNEKNILKNIQLFPSKIQDLEAVNITTKRTNPGREIMKKVVAKRDQINPWSYAHKVNVYIKAKEKIISF